MKIVVIGAGAMGCLYGAYLSQKHEVIMLDSFQMQVDAINEHGITVLEEDGTEQHFANVKSVWRIQRSCRPYNCFCKVDFFRGCTAGKQTAFWRAYACNDVAEWSWQ